MRVWPEYIELNYFAAQLAEEYFNDNIPRLIDETRWQEWAASVCGLTSFSKANVPSPYSIKGENRPNNFSSWQEWAKAAFICMNGANPDTLI